MKSENHVFCRFGLFLILIVGICSCTSSGAKQQVLQLSRPVQVRAELQDFYTASEGLAQCLGAALANSPDVRLVKVEGRWVERGGRSQEWSYFFISAQLQELLIYERGQLNQRSSLNSEELKQMLSLRDVNLAKLDSDAVALTLEGLQEPGFPLKMEQSDQIWSVSSEAGNWRIDARSGALLP